MKLVISSTIMEELQALAMQNAPHEICGIMFGDSKRVDDTQICENVAADPERHFEINPRELIAAEREMRAGGRKIIGYFHSHPSGKVEPSRTDAASAAADGRIWLILNGKKAAAWVSVKRGEIFNRFDPIRMECPLD